MRKIINSLVLVAALLPFVGCKKSGDAAVNSSEPAASAPASPPATPPAAGGRQTSFQEVTAQLDPGGSLFLYVSTEQWLTGLSTRVSDLREVMLSLPGPGLENRDDIERAFDLAAKLIKSSGVEEVSGVGASGVEVAPGLFRNTLVTHHAAGAGQGFLWSMFGRAPHQLSGQDMLPANTALAAFGDLEVTTLWEVIARELAQSGLPQAEEMARSWPKIFESKMKMPWAELLASLGGEIGVLLTLDETETIDLPLGPRQRLQLPAPALVLAVKVKNDLLYDRLSAEMQKNPQAVTADEEGVKMCSLSMEGQLPIPLQPTVATSGDYFYFATSPDAIRSVQAVRKGKQASLKKSAEFQELTKHLPATGNQFFYVGPQFGTAIGEIQKQVVRSSGMPPEQLALMQKFFGGGLGARSLAIGMHTPTGWKLTSVGNQDSASGLLLAPTVAVTAVAAGLVLPALAKAKSRAQAINSVNQLKQIGLAARIYANDHQDKLPPAETWCDTLRETVGNPKVYKSPADGQPGGCSYAYNASLAGLDAGKVAPDTVMFFETEAGWNQHGGRELLLPRPRASGVYVIGLVDGSVRQVQPARIGSLRWEP